jgi:chromosome segregation ATPase
MLDQGLEELTVLNKKIDELLERYSRLKERNNELRIENETLKLNLHEKNEKIKDLESRYERLKISGALMGDGGNSAEAKKRINELVREIDRCVALLNR